MLIRNPALTAALCALALTALPAAADAATTVHVALQDPSTGSGVKTMQLLPTPDTVPAGPVTFHIVNQSKRLVHEMLLLKAPADGNLPYNKKTQRVIESETVKLVDSGDIQPGSSLPERAALKPGKYLMICNQPDHYMSGMKTAFTVTP